MHELPRNRDSSSVEFASRLSASTTDWRTWSDEENEEFRTKFRIDSIGDYVIEGSGEKKRKKE